MEKLKGPKKQRKGANGDMKSQTNPKITKTNQNADMRNQIAMKSSNQGHEQQETKGTLKARTGPKIKTPTKKDPRKTWLYF